MPKKSIGQDKIQEKKCRNMYKIRVKCGTYSTDIEYMLANVIVIIIPQINVFLLF